MNFFERFIGARYLFSQKKSLRSKTKDTRPMMRFTSLISVGGVAIGVMALIVVMSVMNGFGNDLKNKILGFKSHILIEGKDFLPFHYNPQTEIEMGKVDRTITEVMPFVMGEMIVRVRGSVTGILYKGVPKQLMKDSFTEESGSSNIHLGQELALLLDVIAGDEVEVISPIETTGPMGSLPKIKKYKVSGFIKTGVYEYDTKLAYVPLKEAQKFLEYGNKIDGYEIKIKKPLEYMATLTNLKRLNAISDLNIRAWPELNRTLFSALKLEKLAMFVILSFIVLVAALNIITTITRTVMEKKKEIAILKTMGAQAKQILYVFLFQGLCIGISGIVLGVLGGYLLCLGLNSFELIHLPDIYYDTSIPVAMESVYFITTSVVALVITVVSSLYPAWKASKLDPLTGLK